MFEHTLDCYAEYYGAQHKDTNKASIKRKNSNEDNVDAVSQNPVPFNLTIEVKFRMHLCYKELKQFSSAIRTMQSIPQESV